MLREAKNYLDGAKSIAISSNSQVFKDHLRGTDAEQYYRLRLKKRSHFELRLKKLKSNADLELIHDRNGNKTRELGEVVASSRAPDRRKETIDIQGLEPGTYFIRVFARENRRTRYRLKLSTRSTSKVSFAYQVVQQTNALRLERGLHPLALNTQLSKTAQRYAEAMATQDFFSHTGADGSTWQQRILNSGYNFSSAAENLAIGYATPAQVIQGWMNSPGHRDNMLAYQVQEIGVGYFYLNPDQGQITSNHYWAESFGTLMDSPDQPVDELNRSDRSRHQQTFFDKLDR
jgi:uncharacterized protein YkwD